MFTGLVTQVGTITEARDRPGEDLEIRVTGPGIAEGLALGGSVACQGVCLTAITVEPDGFRARLSAETRARTADIWHEARRLNLERSLKLGDELGGHLVTGHVDGLGEVAAVEQRDSSLLVTLRAPTPLGGALAPKGSLAVDGVSLTINSVEDTADGPRVAFNIIPHTAGHTTLGTLAPGDTVHLEVDLIARYVARLLALRSPTAM